MRKLFLIIVFFTMCLSRTQAQQAMDYTIQANIIYRFTKYIEWPDTKKTDNFIIGVIGDSPVTDELKGFIINKTVAGRKIVIKNFSSSAEKFRCDMLFITEDESGSVKRIAVLTAADPILIVTESNGLALKGSCINFTVVSDHLKLEINKNNIDRRGLAIASELLQLGILVK